MPFVCTLAAAERPEPIVVEMEGQASAITAIGYDSERPLAFRAVATLLGRADAELVISIVAVAASDGAVVADFLSGRRTRFIAKREDRAAVLTAIVDAARAVVVARRPRTILRETFDEQLPQKALRKHHLIGAAIASCGYALAEQRYEDGFHVWKMVRTSAAIAEEHDAP